MRRLRANFSGATESREVATVGMRDALDQAERAQTVQLTRQAGGAQLRHERADVGASQSPNIEFRPLQCSQQGLRGTTEEVEAPSKRKPSGTVASSADYAAIFRPSRDRKGQHSIRINDQWRVCFVWKADGAYNVEIVGAWGYAQATYSPAGCLGQFVRNISSFTKSLFAELASLRCVLAHPIHNLGLRLVFDEQMAVYHQNRYRCVPQRGVPGGRSCLAIDDRT